MQIEDFNSAVWKRHEAGLKARLAELRALNDSPADALKTAEIRGRIAEVKTILALPSGGAATKPGAEWPHGDGE
jgi:hypothetical protein